MSNNKEQKKLTEGDGAKKGKNPEGEMSFFDHLEELRWHIIRSVLAILVFMVVAFMFKNFIFNEIIFKPKMPDFWTNRMFAKLGDWLGSEAVKINQKDLNLISIQMAGQFMTHIWTSMVVGMIVAAPVIFYEFWSFVKPALYENEKKYASGAVVYTTILFLIGVLFGYYIIVPLSLQFLGGYRISDLVENQINITSYISLVVSVCMSSGVVFLLPIFAYFLSKVGIITPEFMKKYRRHAYVLLAVVAAVITPPDVFSMIMVDIPLILLYEVSIFISARVEKQRLKQLAA